MFDITPTKTFKDSVHGYINIPVCFVDNIIDTDIFQRLRNIDQTGMRVLYPNAKHDRFSHSLGVFYLGSKAVDSLLLNFASNPYWKISSDNSRALFWAKNKLLFLLACLLHDIGHTPFSHSLEDLVLENSREGSDSFTQLLIREITAREKMGETVTDIGKAAAHEKMGAMLVLQQFRDKIKKIYEYLQKNKFPKQEDSQILYAEHYRNESVIDTSQLDDDICFIVRMILGLKYKGYEPEKQIRNCFIELLNGGNFDVDKLDYIVRDTKMSGISNIDIDTERLLGSVCIILKTRYIDADFKDQDFSGHTIHRLNNLTAQQNKLHLKGKFSGTLILGPNSCVSIAQGSSFMSLVGSSEDTKIQYIDDSAKFEPEAVIYQNGTLLYTKINNTILLPPPPNNEPFKVNLQNAVLTAGSEFRFRVCGKDSMSLTVNGYCDVIVEGISLADGEISFFPKSESLVNGKIHEMELMGDKIEEMLPTPAIYNTFSLGFKKQALSIIANVLEARNYLYLWVYAHHKVIYYANFLIPAITNMLLPSKQPGETFPCWSLNYKDLAYLDDFYVWTVIKSYRWSNGTAPVGRLCSELLDRKYKRSLFKSLAEYDLLFTSYTKEQKNTLKSRLTDAVDKEFLYVMEDSVVTAGFIKGDIVKKLKERPGMERLTEVVFVDAGYQRKFLNTRETFVEMHGKAISLDKISLLADKKGIADDGQSPYFYLYYSSETEDAEERVVENEAMKDAIRDYEYFINIL